MKKILLDLFEESLDFLMMMEECCEQYIPFLLIIGALLLYAMLSLFTGLMRIVEAL